MPDTPVFRCEWCRTKIKRASDWKRHLEYECPNNPGGPGEQIMERRGDGK